MGAFSASTPRSERMTMLVPARTASLTRRQTSAIAFSSPAPPASGGKRIGMVVALKAQAPERPLGVLR